MCCSLSFLLPWTAGQMKHRTTSKPCSPGSHASTPTMWMGSFSKAPGFSAFNKVERRMAPLSKDTAGIVLPFEKFGSYLNSSNKTIDTELEKRNFAAAGEILASVWSETILL